MRTNEEWIKRIYPKILLDFPPRLRNDVQQYPPKKIPAIGSYYIWGNTNAGKTVLAAHMYIEAKKKKYFEKSAGEYKFINFYDFFLQLQRGFDNQERNANDILEEFSMLEYLILDDVGSTAVSEWGNSMLQILINNRYENMLHTVITSNLNLDDLSIVLKDERTVSRIRRMCKILKLT